MGDNEVLQAQRDNVSKPAKTQGKKDIARAPVKKEDKKGLMEKAKAKIDEAKASSQPKEKEAKILIDREYMVPLRQGWLKVPEYKRATKAVKTLKQFIAQHMKVYDRDLRKIKVDIILNNEIRYRGMRKPPARIKVRAIKYDTGIVEVKLVNIPTHIKFELARKERKKAEAAEKQASAPVAKAPIEAPKDKKTEAEVKDEKEKEQSSKEAMEQLEKAQAKQAQHTPSKKAPVIQRKALKK